MDEAELERMLEESCRENARREETKRRWEQKHGTVDHYALHYLYWKPGAVAKRRLTERRAVEIEHMLAHSFSSYSEAEMDSLVDELLHLSRMAVIDLEIEEIVSPRAWMEEPHTPFRPDRKPRA